MASVRVPDQRPLAPSVTSVTNDKGDNEMILGAVHRSPGICLTAEENSKLQKTSAKGPSDEGAVQPIIASNGVPFLQMRSIGSHSTPGREMEGKKRRVGSCVFVSLMIKIIVRLLVFIPEV